MDPALFLSIFLTLGVLYLILGVRASKNIVTNEDYFLAGRDLGTASLTFTLIATQLGGGMLLGTADAAYKVGYFGILYTLGIVVGFLLLGMGFAAKLRAFNVSTTVELFETHYDSILLKKVGSAIMVASLLFVLVSQVVGSRRLMVGLGIHNEAVIIVFWFFIILYTMLGGLKAVVVTDIAQVIFLVAVFIGVFFYSLFGEPWSFFTFTSFAQRQQSFASTQLNFSHLFGFFLMPVLFNLIEQDIAQRFFAARSQRVARVSAFASAFGLLAFLVVPVYFGMKAHLSGVAVNLGASALIMMLSSISNDFVMSFVVCAVIAAVVSTADSLLCAISSNIAQDFDFTFLGITNRLAFSKVITLIVGIVAMFTAYFFTDILEILRQSYELPVSCLFVSIFACYYNKPGLKKEAATLSIIAGLVGFFFFRMYPVWLPREVASLLLSFVGYIAGWLVSGLWRRVSPISPV